MPAPVTFFGQRAGTEAEPREERNNGVARRLQSLVDSKSKATPTGGYEADVTVVYDAMKEALAQAESSRERQQDPAIGSLWTAAIEQMQDALTKLDQAKSSPAHLGTALKAQQGAYEALLKVRDREFQVTRGQNRQQQGGGAGEEARQRQLEQLDLTQEENRYESQKQAQAQQNPQRREEQQVLNRLRELAQQHGLDGRLRSVSIRNQKTRWGSCSPRGLICLNWRLMQVPESVRDYILLHELAHLRHLNHSRSFWNEVERLCPAYKEAEAWLKRSGKTVL